MARSSKNKMREETAFIYTRISRDDDLDGDSNSIVNQKKLLTKAAKDKGYTNLVYFCDDGVSGVTMNRPDFVRMMEELALGKAAAVFVKDLSRLGRNYIEVGRLTEEFFPEHDIRLIAVSDGIDTCEGESEFAPIKNLFNEWYARDISKKRRISYKIKGNSGIPIGPPPYGYVLRPDGSGLWDLDEEPAAVLRKIASLRFDGLGSNQIADWLTEHKILTPVAYKASKGKKTPQKLGDDPYRWAVSTVNGLLSKQEYCGDVVNFKTYSKSYKNKKRYLNDPEKIVIFKDVNPAIWSRDTFERLQSMSNGTRKRKPKEGERNMFAGILKCADCGKNLNYHFNQRNHDIKYFNCPGYNQGKRKACQSTHYIRMDFLEQVVLSEVRRLTRFACRYEDSFTNAVANYSKKAMETDQRVRASEIKALMARDKEIDMLFEKIYEDNALGKISDERFKKLADKYEEEQSSIGDRIAELKKKFDEATSKVANTDTFLAAVRKYTKIKKLTPRILTELIDHIEVHQAETVPGGQIQRIVIFYNCIGSMVIPDDVDIPLPQITMKTRQGVAVTYDPLPLATV